MSADILGTSWDTQCRSMVQYSLTSTETRRLVRTDSPGRPPRLSHSSWTMSSTFENSCLCTSLGMPECREMTEQIDWQVKQSSQVACITEETCWGAWDITCWHKAKYITPSIAWRREAWRDERGPLSMRWTLELFHRKCTLGNRNFWETRWSAECAFPQAQIQSWTEHFARSNSVTYTPTPMD